MPTRSGSGKAPAARQHARERLHQGVHRVERCAAVRSRVEIPGPGPDLDVEIAEPAHRDVEARDVALDHAAVEDDRRVGAPAVGCDPVHDRMPADLLLAVAGKSEVDGQLTS